MNVMSRGFRYSGVRGAALFGESLDAILCKGELHGAHQRLDHILLGG